MKMGQHHSQGRRCASDGLYNVRDQPAPLADPISDFVSMPGSATLRPRLHGGHW